MSIFRKIYNYYFSPSKDLARKIKSVAGFIPNDLTLFKLAFAHKSSSNEKDYAIQNNERLEYLGDAVLGTIVAEYLFRKYPNANEGFLTKMRSKIVKRSSLNEIADSMGLEIILSEYNSTKLSKAMLGNALEALVGAVYIETGYNYTYKYVVRRIMRKYLNIHELESYDDNYKSQLLEWCQKNGKEVNYKVLSKYKHDKRDKFKIGVFIDGEQISSADDYNKKAAEQTASELAIKQLQISVQKEEDQ
ncbi:MAG TPA: ribonuclease III [Saprospiraceae bacterium]|nr:ribonuclease III [Saprospiraceae bacterium]HMW74162.1 ribonuclease III [Saprospiraceae bacterium]HMX82320.1 ribonuclease III [Saprospiraceae bacterium]HMX84702.1 ribonuclease III [Saprospiraceae bacterium]HMZ72554.1 ribonuclease III [Saprospiraceae bacterium]